MKWFFVLSFVVLAGCVSAIPPYMWQGASPEQEAEYASYMVSGAGVVTGQAFLQRRDGVTVRAAGRIVTLDPATSYGRVWWNRPVRYVHEYFNIPPSTAFLRARRCIRADADGNFRFENLPAGVYFVQVSVTWQPGSRVQGGMVGAEVEVVGGRVISVALGPGNWRIDRASLPLFFRRISGEHVPLAGRPEPTCPE